MAIAPLHPDDPRFVYDEFSYFEENLTEYGLDVAVPHVERIAVVLSDERELSMLKWGNESVGLLCIHGGAQNAHTWDTMLLALEIAVRDIGVLAVDLPGHGHSSKRDDGQYDPASNADAIHEMLQGQHIEGVVVVGMSLGGLTAMSLAARYPKDVSSLVIVDITPGVNSDKAKDIHAFVEGPQSFDTFDSIFERTKTYNPTRTASSLRRGILHNAHKNNNGTWSWNYDRRSMSARQADQVVNYWDDVSALCCPVTFVRGGLSPVVDDDDIAEFSRRQPTVHIHVAHQSGHSVQGDEPVLLAGIVRDVLNNTS